MESGLEQEAARAGTAIACAVSLGQAEPKRWPLFQIQKRRIETVIGQLIERFHAKWVWARDLWHFFTRSLRKVMAHTLFVQLCQQHELLPLYFAELVID